MPRGDLLITSRRTRAKSKNGGQHFLCPSQYLDSRDSPRVPRKTLKGILVKCGSEHSGRGSAVQSEKLMRSRRATIMTQLNRQADRASPQRGTEIRNVAHRHLGHRQAHLRATVERSVDYRLQRQWQVTFVELIRPRVVLIAAVVNGPTSPTV